jgi:hypothetical protein
MDAGQQPDDAILDRIAAAFDRELPPIPERLSAAAVDAFQWHRADAILAELVFDTANDELVGVRGVAGERRSFRYASGDAVIRVHLTAATMTVMVEPPLSVPCRIATTSGSVEHRTDEYGELVTDAPELPIRIEIDLPGGAVVTPWITA